jgi:hypothetical protein
MLILKLVRVALLNNRHLILVAAIFAMGMLVGGLIVLPVVDGIDVFKQADAKNTKPKNPNHKRGHFHG